MGSEMFWLDGAQMRRLWPLLPDKTRGKKRVDNRRVISGIVHVLKNGCRWVDAPRDFGPHKTLYGRYVRWSGKGVWRGLFKAFAEAGGPPSYVLIDSSAVRAHRPASGGKEGTCDTRSGGRTTKVYAVADRFCRPLRFLLTGGQVPDRVAPEPLIALLPEGINVICGDKGYDANAVERIFGRLKDLRRIAKRDDR